MPLSPLDPDALYRACPPEQFTFATTAEIADRRYVIGQERAEEAVRFGIDIQAEGYNLVVVGPSGTGRRALVAEYLQETAAAADVPQDWCYVNNFDDPSSPLALSLPPGRALLLRDAMKTLVEDASAALHAAFESEEYQVRRQTLHESAREQEEAALQELQERARSEDIALLRTPSGFAFAPLLEGEVLGPNELQKLEQDVQQRMQKAVEGFQVELQKILRQVPRKQRELREEVRKLNRDVAGYAIAELVDGVKAEFDGLVDVQSYIDAAREDVLDRVESALMEAQEEGGGSPLEDAIEPRDYSVNVLVDHSHTEGAPVVHADNPHYQSLVGEVEQIAQMGTLVTDFNLIKAGALHRANGGYLVVEARRLLAQSFAWEGLKRALYANEIRIETPSKALGLMSTVTLSPQAIPLKVKVILVGEPDLYYLLQAHDPDFMELFKVMADFDDRVPRDNGRDLEYAELLGSLAERDALRALDRSAVCRMIEQSARIAGDAERLSAHLQRITDLLKEADFWAERDEADSISERHVQRAIDAKVRRSDRVRDRMFESILRDTIHIQTEGAVVGQINGLAVLQLGQFAFGKPSRITARARLGKGEVVDIEREVAMGGPLHSKGMLILSGYLANRYAADQPLSLYASIVFEQSYGGVDGDSASSTELYALLSAISGVAIKQGFAVTGSVDQFGRIQPIGGVNEKIEGFFDICLSRGLTGDQGVLIPADNVKHLMLRPDIVQAVRDGRFAIYAVTSIDEGIELLTGLPAGDLQTKGQYPKGSINRAVADRLTDLTKTRLALMNGNEDFHV